MTTKGNPQRLVDLAIKGLKAEIAELEVELASISKGVAVGVQTLASKKPRRRLSAAARKAISLAQRARWAKRTRPIALITKKTRKLSAAARKKISEASKRRWAKVRADRK